PPLGVLDHALLHRLGAVEEAAAQLLAVGPPLGGEERDMPRLQLAAIGVVIAVLVAVMEPQRVELRQAVHAQVQLLVIHCLLLWSVALLVASDAALTGAPRIKARRRSRLSRREPPCRTGSLRRRW